MSYHICQKMCKECPFSKKSAKGYTGPYRPEQIVEIVMKEHRFSCHMTHEVDISFEQAGTKAYPLCAGSLLFMRKSWKIPRDRDLADAMRLLSVDDLSLVLGMKEFIDHHSVLPKTVI